MTAGELCTRTVATARKTDWLFDVARVMRNQHTGSVIVVEPDGKAVRPIGIVSDRDLVVSVLAKAPLEMGRLRVGDILTTSLLTAREEELVHVVLRRMRALGVRRVPVVDTRGDLIGVLAFDDVVDFIAEEMADLAALLRRETVREQTLRA